MNVKEVNEAVGRVAREMREPKVRRIILASILNTNRDKIADTVIQCLVGDINKDKT